MIFDEGVLNVICSFIDDPKTFRAFSSVSKRTWKVYQLYVDAKMNQFVRWKTNIVTGNELIDIGSLPNGAKHGLNKTERWGVEEAIEKEYFRNGRLLAKYMYTNLTDYVHFLGRDSIKEELIIYDDKVTVEFAMKNLLDEEIIRPDDFVVKRVSAF